MSRSYLLVIGEDTALAWVLAEQRMAFPALRRAQAARLEIGDELLVYTTRGKIGIQVRGRWPMRATAPHPGASRAGGSAALASSGPR